MSPKKRIGLKTIKHVSNQHVETAIEVEGSRSFNKRHWQPWSNRQTYGKSHLPQPTEDGARGTFEIEAQGVCRSTHGESLDHRTMVIQTPGKMQDGDLWLNSIVVFQSIHLYCRYLGTPYI